MAPGGALIHQRYWHQWHWALMAPSVDGTRRYSIITILERIIIRCSGKKYRVVESGGVQ